mmetsp:Transcript_20517/g.61139  ORF Transcript_20517/g.61139 Transcript_20517/m.61139 type:complete len:411 (-) Transcript_20517:259-1491(-)
MLRSSSAGARRTPAPAPRKLPEARPPTWPAPAHGSTDAAPAAISTAACQLDVSESVHTVLSAASRCAKRACMPHRARPHAAASVATNGSPTSRVAPRRSSDSSARSPNSRLLSPSSESAQAPCSDSRRSCGHADASVPAAASLAADGTPAPLSTRVRRQGTRMAKLQMSGVLGGCSGPMPLAAAAAAAAAAADAAAGHRTAPALLPLLFPLGSATSTWCSAVAKPPCWATPLCPSQCSSEALPAVRGSDSRRSARARAGAGSWAFRASRTGAVQPSEAGEQLVPARCSTWSCGLSMRACSTPLSDTFLQWLRSRHVSLLPTARSVASPTPVVARRSSSRLARSACSRGTAPSSVTPPLNSRGRFARAERAHGMRSGGPSASSSAVPWLAPGKFCSDAWSGGRSNPEPGAR